MVADKLNSGEVATAVVVAVVVVIKEWEILVVTVVLVIVVRNVVKRSHGSKNSSRCNSMSACGGKE